jgi:membrane protein implicated in regulation of membrane protease activity
MMAMGLVWWVATGALVIAELVTGTFYLLMIALGCAAGGVAHLLGLSLAAQLALAALVALAAVAVLRRTRPGRRRGGLAGPTDAAADASTDVDVQLDIGETLRVSAWHDGRARAMYRGAEWDVELAPGEPDGAQRYVIKQVRGNRLIVAAQH